MKNALVFLVVTCLILLVGCGETNTGLNNQSSLDSGQSKPSGIIKQTELFYSPNKDKVIFLGVDGHKTSLILTTSPQLENGTVVRDVSAEVNILDLDKGDRIYQSIFKDNTVEFILSQYSTKKGIYCTYDINSKKIDQQEGASFLVDQLPILSASKITKISITTLPSLPNEPIIITDENKTQNVFNALKNISVIEAVLNPDEYNGSSKIFSIEREDNQNVEITVLGNMFIRVKSKWYEIISNSFEVDNIINNS